MCIDLSIDLKSSKITFNNINNIALQLESLLGILTNSHIYKRSMCLLPACALSNITNLDSSNLINGLRAYGGRPTRFQALVRNCTPILSPRGFKGITYGK